VVHERKGMDQKSSFTYRNHQANEGNICEEISRLCKTRRIQLEPGAISPYYQQSAKNLTIQRIKRELTEVEIEYKAESRTSQEKSSTEPPDFWS